MRKFERFLGPTRSVVIVYRPGKPEAKKFASELGEWLTDQKIKVYCHPKRRFQIHKKPADVPKTVGRLDLVIVLGGDGTYLEALRLVGDKKVPFIGFNMGSLGFLTENRVADARKIIESALEGKLEKRPRSMVHLKLKHKGQLKKEALAINDIVVERGSRPHLIFVEVTCDGQPVKDMRADGLIVATPTGSTAYNLAAGGPICHPEVNAFVVTPVCPHSLTNRPLIFPGDLKLKIQLKPGVQKASLTVDGKHFAEIGQHHEIIIEKCKQCHFVLKKPSHNYFTLLNEKLGFAMR